MGFQSGSVVAFNPGTFDIQTVGARNDIAWNFHVIDLPYSGAENTVVDKVLPQIDLSRALIATVHEGLARRSTRGALTVDAVENHALFREAVDIGRLADLVPIAAEHTRFQIIGNDEDEVFDFCVSDRWIECIQYSNHKEC